MCEASLFIFKLKLSFFTPFFLFFVVVIETGGNNAIESSRHGIEERKQSTLRSVYTE